MEEMGLTFDITRYSITDGSLQASEFRTISPAGRVPALEIDGTTLFESGAIAEVLCDTYPETGLGRVAGHPERGAFLEWLHFSETMASLVETLNLSHVFLRPPAKPSVPVLKITTARLKAVTFGMENRLSKDGYLLPSGFSAADTMMGFNLFALPYYMHLDPFPKICAYRDRLAARPEFQKARARDGRQAFYSKDFYPIPDADAS
jgi:glutathione S-transferase